MTQHVKLHGGPMGGAEMELSDRSNHFFILSLTPPTGLTIESTGHIPEIETRKGRYSRVGTKGTDFEWDGWGH